MPLLVADRAGQPPEIDGVLGNTTKDQVARWLPEVLTAGEPVVISSVYPGAAHDASVARVLLPDGRYDLRWVDARLALLFPGGQAAELIAPSSTPLHTAFAAYAHQVQHEKPDLAFWLGVPVHFFHHRDNMWHHNFGIGVSLWDRLLGTYKAAEWSPERPLREYPLSEFVSIRWR